MRINTKTAGIELTEALSQYVDEKAEAIEKFLDPSDESAICDVEIGISTKHHQAGEIYRAEITLTVAGGHFRAESEQEDLYVAINDAKEDIVQSVNSHRDKKRTLTRKGDGVLKKVLRNFKGEEK